MAYFPISIPVAARRIRMETLPAWLLWYTTLAFCHAAYVSLEPRRPDVVGAAALPLAWFALERLLSIHRAREEGRPWRLSAVAASVAVLLPITVLFARPNPVPHETIRAAYEVTGIAGALLVFVWLAAHDKRAAMVFFGAGLVYGLVLENSGIMLGFFHEEGYRLYIPPFVAPVVTILGWSVAIFLASWYVLRLGKFWPALRRWSLAAGATAALVALSFDAVIDPVAAQVGFWEWHSTLPVGPLGVPPVNWIAWACAVTPFAHLVFRVAPDGRLDEERVRLVFRGVPLALCYAAVSFVATMLLVEGPQGPSWSLLHGAAARMLAFAGL